jgi:hypothetical protein
MIQLVSIHRVVVILQVIIHAILHHGVVVIAAVHIVIILVRVHIHQVVVITQVHRVMIADRVQVIQAAVVGINKNER